MTDQFRAASAHRRIAHARRAVFGVLVTTLSACGEQPSAPDRPTAAAAKPLFSAIDGASLARSPYRWLGGRAQGCLVALNRRDGQLQQIAVARRDLPFALPIAARTAAMGGQPQAAIAHLELAIGGTGARAGLSCVVPAGYTSEHLARTVARTADAAEWSSMFRTLASARPRPAVSRDGLSAEDVANQCS